jgi:tRNA(Ile)-lysidine synthase
MDVLERIAATGLLEAGRPVVVLLSGGRDSVCLLDVAAELCGTDAVRALHVNYGLRAEADDDEAHCAAVCAALGAELEVERAARPDDAPCPSPSQAPRTTCNVTSAPSHRP